MTTEDRRSTIEAAFEAAEKEVSNVQAAQTTPAQTTNVEAPASATPEAAASKPAETQTTEQKVPTAEKPAELAESKPAESKPAESKPAESKPAEPKPVTDPTADQAQAPRAWKAAARTKWATLDPEVRAEISRREHEMSRNFGESAYARQHQKQFLEIVAPFQQRLQAMGAQPLQVVQGLLQADYLLATAAPRRRAELVAKLITDYGVDVRELDNVLAGSPASDPVTHRVDQLLQERLAPVQQFLTAQQQQQMLAQETHQTQMQAAIDAMAADAEKFPHFEAVRNTMADLFEINARRGVSLTLEEAYNKAVGLDPQLAQQLATQQEAARLMQAAAQAAQAKNASLSVTGAPVAKTVASPATDRRSQIAAALESLSNR